MLNELYDDVLSVLKEKGFVDWFHKNHNRRISPLRWCYDDDGTMRAPITPPKGIKWIVFTHDEHVYFPHTLIIDDDGTVGTTCDIY
jgi:hypothetical protein